MLVLLFSFACGKEEQRSISLGDFSDHISKKAGSYFIVNFAEMAQTGFTFPKEESRRGDYFRQIEKTTGIDFDTEAQSALLVELNRKPSQFGINAYLFDNSADTYFVITGRFDKILKNRNDSREAVKEIDGRPLRFPTFRLPVADMKDTYVFISSLSPEMILLASNERSVREYLATQENTANRLGNNSLLARAYGNLNDEHSYFGCFTIQGEAIPENYHKVTPGIETLAAVAIESTVDSRIALTNLNFIFSNIHGSTRFFNSITKFRNDHLRSDSSDEAFKDMMKQVTLRRDDEVVRVEFHMTHTHIQAFEDILRAALEKLVEVE